VSKSRTRLNYVVAPGLYLMSDNLVMNMPNVRGYNNELKIAGEGLSMGVNDDLNTKMVGQVLTPNLDKPSPIKRMPIDNNIRRISEKSSKTSKTDDTSNNTKQQSSRATCTSMINKHGVIYDTESNSNSEHEDMKTLLIVSEILAGLGFMYFKS